MQERGLPAAVGAPQGDALAGLQAKAALPEHRPQGVVAEIHVVKANQRLAHVVSYSKPPTTTINSNNNASDAMQKGTSRREKAK